MYHFPEKTITIFEKEYRMLGTAGAIMAVEKAMQRNIGSVLESLFSLRTDQIADILKAFIKAGDKAMPEDDALAVYIVQNCAEAQWNCFEIIRLAMTPYAEREGVAKKLQAAKEAMQKIRGSV